jgi:RHS repeat-associated protein
VSKTGAYASTSTVTSGSWSNGVFTPDGKISCGSTCSVTGALTTNLYVQPDPYSLLPNTGCSYLTCPASGPSTGTPNTYSFNFSQGDGRTPATCDGTITGSDGQLTAPSVAGDPLGTTGGLSWYDSNRLAYSGYGSTDANGYNILLLDRDGSCGLGTPKESATLYPGGPSVTRYHQPGTALGAQTPGGFAFSPDHTQVAYGAPSTTGPGWLLHVANVNGTNDHLIGYTDSQNYLMAGNPVWSPAGDRLLINGGMFNNGVQGPGHFFVANADGSGGLITLPQATWAGCGVWYDDTHVYSAPYPGGPSNDQLAYVGLDGVGTAIGPHENLTENGGVFSSCPTGQANNGYIASSSTPWTNQDGTQNPGITYVADRNDNPISIWRDGGFTPWISPDGSHVAWIGPIGPYSGIIVDGGPQTILPSGWSTFANLLWSPDSTHLAYEAGPQGPSSQWSIFTAKPNLSVLPFGQTLGYGLGNNPSGSMNDPVNTATGAYWTQEQDMEMPGIRLTFAVQRSYNSLSTASGGFGQGWSWSYGTNLAVQQNGDVLANGPDGQQMDFTLQGDGSYTAAGATSTLTLAGGVYTLQTRGANTYEYDSSGHLLSLNDRNGNAISFQRDGNGVLQTVTDTVGRVITVSHNAQGLISEIALPDGRNVQYGYTNGLLTSVTDLRGKVWNYAYDAAGRLASIQDPRGHYEVRNTYDPTSGRITQQLDADGNPTTYSWDASSQTATTTDPKGKVWSDYYNGNKLIARSDPLGDLTVYGYDSNFDQTSVTTPNGNTTNMTYDSHGNMLTRTSPAPFNYKESWTYNGNNDVLTYTDGRNNQTVFQYDGHGNLTQKTSPGNLITLYGRDPAGTGLLTSMTTPRGKVWNYGYDSQGNLTSQTDPDGNKTTYGYDTTGRMTSITTPRGNVAGCNCAATYTTQLTYDDGNHVLTSTDPLGHETQYGYGDNGNLTSIENAKLETTNYGYNSDNELTSVTYPDNSSVSYGYDSRGNKTSYTDQLAHETTYGYDDANRLTSTVSPLGNLQGGNPSQYTTTYGRDPDGNLTSVTDPLGHATTYGYDQLDRGSSMITARGNVSGCSCASQYTWNYAYDANGNVTSVTDPLGNQTSYGYDGLDHQTSMTDGRNKTWTYGYDADGNLTSVQDQDGHLTTYGYDNADLKTSMVDARGNVSGCGCASQYTWNYGYDPDHDLTGVTDPNGHLTQYGYDAAGRKTSLVDPNSHETDYGYDQLNRLTSVTAPASGTTSYGYDNVGNLTSRTDANQHLTQYNYDTAHRLTSVVKPSGTWSYSYDANNEVTQKVDANGNATPSNPNDGLTNYGYNNDGTLASVNYSDSTPTVSYTYDPEANVLTMSDGQTNQAVYTWNADGKMLTDARGTAKFTYHYDAAGNVIERSYPDGVGDVTYGYNNEEQMSSLSSVGGGSANYTYDPAGNPTLISAGNGYGQVMQYGPAGQLTEVKNATSGGSGTVLSKYDLTYDPAGNPLQLTAQNNGSNWTENYTYDNANRLTAACYNAACASATDYAKWTYDSVGNRLTETGPNASTTYSYNSADELTQTVKNSAAVNPYAQTVQTDGASPYFRLGETSGSSFASTPSGFTGTWTGSPTLNVTGATAGDSNGAVKLNGSSQYGTVANSSTLSKSNNFTVELWIKRGSSTGVLQAIAGKPLTTTTKSENYGIWLTAANKVEFQVGNGTNKSQVLDSSGTITDTTSWHYVVANFASGVMKLYVDNGTPTTVTAAFTSAGTNSSTFDVGRAGTVDYFNGAIDELAVYPSVLSSAQVSTHYTQAITTPQPSQTTTSYTYNANGQQTGAGSNTFNYNVPAELTSATVGGTTTSYTYDGEGNRLTATSGGSTSDYTWDTNNPLAQLVDETTGTGTLIRRYVNGIDGDGAVGPISMAAPSATYYYSGDIYGSVADMTSSSAATEWAYQYGPFGTARSTTKVDANAPANPIQFDSQYSDGNGLYDLRAREFDSSTGRFLSTDPVSPRLEDGYVSSYSYANNQPTLLNDPSGQCTFCDWAGSVVVGGGEDLGNLALGAGEGAVALGTGAVEFVVHYPTYFDAIRNGVAEGGWSYLGQLAASPFEECANALANQDFRSIGRGCLKVIALAYGAGEGADVAGNLASRLGPDAAAALRDETGAIDLRGFTEAGNRSARYSGKWYDSEDAARRAAEKDASKHPKSCSFRGLCQSGDHYHVDKTINGRVVHTRHYYFSP